MLVMPARQKPGPPGANMFIDFRLRLRLHARNSLVMTPFAVTALSVTLNAAGIVPRAHHAFAGTGSR